MKVSINIIIIIFDTIIDILCSDLFFCVFLDQNKIIFLEIIIKNYLLHAKSENATTVNSE